LRNDFAAQLSVIHQVPPPSMLESLNVSGMSSSPSRYVLRRAS
jgi:hypothetical protein